MKSRILYIDNLKAFAIFLMVLGHVLQYVIAKDTYKDNIAYNFIYSFHMALFMMTSGYVGGMANSKSWNLNKTLKKRATQLLLPFMSWTILYAIIKQSPIYILESIIYPSRSLWFLWALFCITVAFSFIRKVAQDRWMAIWGGYFC